MKILTYCNLVLFITATSFPLTADAFSRRPTSSEISQSQQAGSLPTYRRDLTSDDRKPHSVPEPSSLLLLSIAGIGLVGFLSMRKRFRGSVRK